MSGIAATGESIERVVSKGGRDVAVIGLMPEVPIAVIVIVDRSALGVHGLCQSPERVVGERPGLASLCHRGQIIQSVIAIGGWLSRRVDGAEAACRVRFIDSYHSSHAIHDASPFLFSLIRHRHLIAHVTRVHHGVVGSLYEYDPAQPVVAGRSPQQALGGARTVWVTHLLRSPHRVIGLLRRYETELALIPARLDGPPQAVVDN